MMQKPKKTENIAFIEVDIKEVFKLLLHVAKARGFLMMDKFEDTKSNMDAYGKNIFF